jgi:NAD(P)-dependent dehydrogenase (short-subunit alcohol dehydrogenase family)
MLDRFTGGEDGKAWMRSQVPMGRLGAPEDIARAIVFIASAGFVTGHILAVDGGKAAG